MRGFTLVELLTVMAVIAILAALILSIASFAQKKAALSRAQTEIKRFETACESYKADNGTYPNQPVVMSGTVPATSGTSPSDTLDPRVTGYSTGTTVYQNSSLELYQALTGDYARTTEAAAGRTTYLADLKSDMLGRSDMTSPVSASNLVTYLSDPFGNSYGYSTMNATAQAAAIASGSPSLITVGYNPTFDLWSTGGTTTQPAPATTSDVTQQWVKNW